MKHDLNNETVPITPTEPIQKYKLSYAFKQQLMKSWRPKPTLKCAITVYVIIGLLFFALGIAILVQSNAIFEYQQQYDTACSTIGKQCSISFTIPKQINQPIYFFYRLTNFYQNHRRYMQSIDFPQLSGGSILDSSKIADCAPVILNSDLFTNVSATGAKLDPASAAFPCGLVARSYFNDTFVLTNTDTNTTIPISNVGIAWPDDINYRFKNANLSLQWIDIQQERFMNWMKVSPFMDFRKTWGVINSNLQAGNYTVFINPLWDSSIFSGQKWIVLSQTNAFGGRNYFLAYSYLSIGGVSILLAILFIFRKITRPRGILDKKIREYS